MGIFDRKEKPDFSDVKSASDTARTGSNAPAGGGSADFSDVRTGSSSAPSSSRSYTVESGDSLSKIAKQFYGDASQWKKIHAANKDAVPNPDLIYPGQTLTIPDA